MSTPTQYINALEEPRKTEVKILHDIIRKTAPSLKPFILETKTSDIIGYGKFSYTTKSGCTGDWFVVGLASRKQYISLYVSCTESGKHLTETYAKNFPKCKVGKGCISIKNLEDVDLNVVEQLAKEATKMQIQ